MDSYEDEENVDEEKINEIPVTSSLFRLNWISDDSDSDDENADDNNRETKQPQSQFLTSDQENSAQLQSPIRGKQNGDDDSKNDKDLTVPSSEDLSTSDRNENQSNYGSLGRRLAKKRSISSRTPSSPGPHIKNAGVVDVSSKIALRKKTKDNPFNSLEKMAAILLNVEEMKLVMHFMYEYCKSNDVELLVSQLYDILNIGHKRQLFVQVREAISPFHCDQFDAALARHHNNDFRKTDSKRQLLDCGNVDQPLLREVQFRRRQLELQLQMSEQMKKVRPKHYKCSNDDELENLITVYVSKNNPTLGISVTRGSDPCNPVLIESVHPGGAAAQTQKILPGMTLISIEDEDIRCVSHQAAVFLIRKAFCSHKRPYLKMILRKPSTTNSPETAAV
ncbi:domain-containing 7 [Octopus vulgaris]|uniref:Domain-containing 7 n=1 Tax=Octopus vulgaris TaxID=6645 RepID=A0AA36FCN5_OCTVU|nr:domain-containing 7 [Octopus vulgaris]